MSRWLVGSSRSSRSGSPASARASEARVSSPPEKVDRLRSSCSSENPSPCSGPERTVAPVPATRVLQPALGARVAVEQGAVVGALRHLALEPAQVLLERHQVAAPGQHVVAQGQAALARRALVVERHARALLEDQLAAVDAGLAGDHPQQRRLARSVPARERHAVAALQLEGDAAEQRGARHVLVESACDHHRHVRVKAKGPVQSSGTGTIERPPRSSPGRPLVPSSMPPPGRRRRWGRCRSGPSAGGCPA